MMQDWSTFVIVTWVTISVVGLTLALLSLRESVTDWKVTKPSNGFRALALGDILTESIRLVIYIAYALLGVFYLAQGTVLHRPIGAAILVVALFLMVLKTVIQIAVRRYVRMTHGRRIDPTEPMTQDQVEDREFGEQRRKLEQQHLEDG